MNFGVYPNTSIFPQQALCDANISTVQKYRNSFQHSGLQVVLHPIFPDQDHPEVFKAF